MSMATNDASVSKNGTSTHTKRPKLAIVSILRPLLLCGGVFGVVMNSVGGDVDEE
jgi:hypothetical protein